MALAITVEGFKARFPEFECVKPAVVTIRLDDAECDTEVTKFEDKIAERIVYTLAAHYLSISQRTGKSKGQAQNVAPITGKTVDKVSATYATAQASGTLDLYLNSTPYGQEYLSLLRRYCASMITANC